MVLAHFFLKENKLLHALEEELSSGIVGALLELIRMGFGFIFYHLSKFHIVSIGRNQVNLDTDKTEHL